MRVHHQDRWCWWSIGRISQFMSSVFNKSNYWCHICWLNQVVGMYRISWPESVFIDAIQAISALGPPTGRSPWHDLLAWRVPWMVFEYRYRTWLRVGLKVWTALAEFEFFYPCLPVISEFHYAILFTSMFSFYWSPVPGRKANEQIQYFLVVLRFQDQPLGS